MKTISVLFSGLALMLATAQAVNFLDFDANTCADPSGFKTCIANVNTNANTCFNKTCKTGTCTGPFNCTSTDQNCVSSCVCSAYSQWINCAAERCWNRAYSCAYQALVAEAFEECPIATSYPPYFPPPLNGTGHCSCNLGTAYTVARLRYQAINTCKKKVSGATLNNECTCCGDSLALSSFAEFCPDTNLSSIPIYKKMEILLEAQQSFKNCSSVSPATCSSLGFAAPTISGTWTWYAAGQVPTGGSKALSDGAGNAPLPTQTSTVWSLYDGAAQTAVYASTNAAAATDVASSTSGSSSASASTTTSTGAAIPNSMPVQSSAVFAALTFIFALVL